MQQLFCQVTYSCIQNNSPSLPPHYPLLLKGSQKAGRHICGKKGGCGGGGGALCPTSPGCVLHCLLSMNIISCCYLRTAQKLGARLPFIWCWLADKDSSCFRCCDLSHLQLFTNTYTHPFFLELSANHLQDIHVSIFPISPSSICTYAILWVPLSLSFFIS